MSPTLRIIYYGLWCTQPALQLAVVVVMFRRKLHRKFPIFFSYILSQMLIFSLLFPIYLNGYWYFDAYWITAAISLTLAFYVIYELFLDVFQPYHTLKDLGTVLFKWAGLVMLLVAGVVSAATPPSQSGPLVQAVLTTERCVRVIQCGLILFLLLFSRYLGVSWRQKNFGIALGFGFFAAVELFLVALVTAGHVNGLGNAFTNIIAYNLSIGVWLAYAWTKEKARESSANLLMSQRWDQSFMDIQHPMPADSLIPMFENMVEEAISRVHDARQATTKSAATEMGAPDDGGQSFMESISASLTAAEPSPERAKSASASGPNPSKQ